MLLTLECSSQLHLHPFSLAPKLRSASDRSASSSHSKELHRHRCQHAVSHGHSRVRPCSSMALTHLSMNRPQLWVSFCWGSPISLTARMSELPLLYR